MSMHRMLVGAAAGLCLAAWNAGGATAQTIDGSLRGVGNFDLLIEQLDDDSATCGITEPGLIKAVRRGVKGAPFSLGGDNYNLYVRVTTLPQDGKCFSAIDVQAYYYGKLVLPNYPDGNYAEVALWENNSVTITSKRGHGGEVGKLVTRLTEALVGDWQKDNS